MIRIGFLLCLLLNVARAEEAPTLQLDDRARPIRYEAELTVDPARATFGGAIAIAIEAKAPLATLWLHASDLSIGKVGAEQHGRAIKVRVLPGNRDVVGLVFEPPLATGQAKVRLAYTGLLPDSETRGAVRQREGNDWYVVTQFEPFAARRVFPCFDQPSSRAPWQLTLRVPAGNVAFGNTPIAKSTTEPDGGRRIVFAVSKPLPSYLVAWAVGPFETVDAGRASRSKTPIQIVTPRGQTGRARWAVSTTREALDRLEAYFGTPYPYEKLDLLAAPVFTNAMENAGLVTFGSRYVLEDPGSETIKWRRFYLRLAVHEIAHQWFGDLVTIAWWDELWLKEAFATWLAQKIVEAWQPQWDIAEARVQSRVGAIIDDSQATARRIRQPITSNDDIDNAFDSITYEKGAAVIGMFERWLGPELFVQGVRAYLRAHEHGAATTNDLLEALGTVSKRNVAASFSTFLDQPGVPVIAMQLVCDSGGPPRLDLAQERHLMLGAAVDAAGGRARWHVPVCVRYGKGDHHAEACGLLTDRTGSLPLGGECPDWVVPNDRGVGYYVAALSPPLLRRLMGADRSPLQLTETLTLLGDVEALLEAGKLDYDVVLRWLPSLVSQRRAEIIAANARLLARTRERVPDALVPTFAKWVRDTYGKQARELGWTARPADTEGTRLLRNILLPLVGSLGEDPQVQAEARRLALSWLRDHASLDAESVQGVLEVAAIHGDAALFDALYAAAKRETKRADRRRMLHALGAFRSPALLARALAVPLDATFDLRESLAIYWVASVEPTTRGTTYAFFKRNFDAIAERTPRDWRGDLLLVPGALCSEADAADVQRSFEPRAASLLGGPRTLARVVESIHGCVAQQQRHVANVSSFFKRE